MEERLRVPDVQILPREIINDMLKVRVQGGVTDEVSGLCLQVSPVFLLFFLYFTS